MVFHDAAELRMALFLFEDAVLAVLRFVLTFHFVLNVECSFLFCADW